MKGRVRPEAVDWSEIPDARDLGVTGCDLCGTLLEYLDDGLPHDSYWREAAAIQIPQGVDLCMGCLVFLADLGEAIERGVTPQSMSQFSELALSAHKDREKFREKEREEENRREANTKAWEERSKKQREVEREKQRAARARRKQKIDEALRIAKQVKAQQQKGTLQ